MAQTPFRITPSLGPELHQVEGQFYWDMVSDPQDAPSYPLGTKVIGNDGHEYVLVRASANIAAASAPGTEIVITEPGFTAAAGGGGFRAPLGGALDGQVFHARRGTL